MMNADSDGSEASSLDARTNDPVIRHDPLSQRTVFVAPRRAARPSELGATATSLDQCPFCAGHEHLTPPDLLRSESEPGVWHARIVPNRYPVVEDLFVQDRATPRDEAAADSLARGTHDVVVEAADHLRSILSIPSNRWLAVWRLVRERLGALSMREDLAWATIFKNSGRAAGASLEHVHSQIVALDFVPPVLNTEWQASTTTAGSFAALLMKAAEDDLIVAESGDLVAMVPPAPRQPLECWILPRHPEPRFHRTSDDAVVALAHLTRWFVSRLDRLVPDAAYNWWLHDAPFEHPRQTGRRRPGAAETSDAQPGGSGSTPWHWHLEILPRLTSFAGFEFATGCHVTTLSAREIARLLREA